MNSKKKALITGSSGLIGSEAAKFLVGKSFQIVGIDNNMRKYFFGKDGDTTSNRRKIERALKDNYVHYNVDIRNLRELKKIFQKHKFELIIHTAAQPSHDWAAREPITDFSVNALGTLYLLELYRKHCPKATFVFTSTNKVYGDNPNFLPLVEQKTRFEISKKHPYKNGIPEEMSLDQTKHSIFGAGKAAADIMVQEYGRYFGLKTGVFRGGCLTGPSHSAAELHGFLAYLVKCVATGKKYTIFGYKGKQVRDNIHSYDLVNMFWHFYKKPRPGEVYNAGGGRFSNISMIEAINKIEKILGKKAIIEYKNKNRIGDHIWYVSDLSKFKSHYPKWKYTYDIDKIIRELCQVYTTNKKTK